MSTDAGVVEPDMTPMIDVAFQLVTFFMIVTNLDQGTIDDRVRLPSDVLARPPKSAVKHGFLVNIGYPKNAQGDRIGQDAKVLPVGDLPLEIPVYGQKLKEEFAKSRKHDEKAALDTVVEIRADGDVPIGKVQDLIRFAREAGYQKFAFRAQTPED